jgi:hypothetical protein
LSELVTGDWKIYEIFRSNTFLTQSLNAIDIGKMSPPAILFQSGYLTVDQRENDESGSRYYLKFPNFEVESATYNLTLGLEDAIKTLPTLREDARALLVSLVNLNPFGFKSAFCTILAIIPSNIHSPNEGYYQTVLLMALGSIGQRYETESRSGDGIFDVQLQTNDGTNFIIELKYVSGKDPKTKKELSPEKLKNRVEQATVKALAQIEDKKYSLKFQGKGNTIYKTALVIGGNSEVMVVFEKADNWRLSKGLDGTLRVEAD